MCPSRLRESTTQLPHIHIQQVTPKAHPPGQSPQHCSHYSSSRTVHTVCPHMLRGEGASDSELSQFTLFPCTYDHSQQWFPTRGSQMHVARLPPGQPSKLMAAWRLVPSGHTEVGWELTPPLGARPGSWGKGADRPGNDGHHPRQPSLPVGEAGR